MNRIAKFGSSASTSGAVDIADSLMSVAATGLFAAKWTKEIEEEWISALERERPDLKGKLSL
jgi:hypothetical protein